MTNQQSSNPAPGKPIPWNFFANYDKATKIKNTILYLVTNVNPHRPQGCLIYGPANNGKSFILKSAMKEINAGGVIQIQDHPLTPGPPMAATPNIVRPKQTLAIYARAPGKANHKMLFFELAKPISMPLSDGATIRMLQNALRRGLIGAGVKVVFMDELQHLKSGGKVGKRSVMDEIKVISDEHRIPFILAGTDMARQVVLDDDQYYSRFRPIELPRWKYNPAFITLLRQFEVQMEVPKGTFSGAKESREIFIKSKGLLGLIVETLNESLAIAIVEDSKRITIEHLRESGHRFSEAQGTDNDSRG